MRLYFKYMAIHFKSQMQYRASFWLLTLGQFLVPFTVFAGLYLMFERFGQLQGWGFFEVAMCFGVVHLSFALSEFFARGFDAFSSLVVTGEFDRLLVRPRSAALQVLGSKFDFSRFGRMLQGAAVLAWAVYGSNVEWTAAKAATLALMVAGGAFVFTGIFILGATLSFWTVQGLETVNVFTDGGREMSKYPLTIYEKWVTGLFTFVIPFGLVSYLPLLYILGRPPGGPDALYVLMPLGGALFLLPCLLVWRFGVRRYRSTGS
ncbi:hypothetical protein FE782_24935 [Paenibacillus antri]|uniref:ABC transporter permease n=1 Tax=Paenibacillus antri TaxID=2582848 RepID=A0A5R9FZZ4_9BACL|nr:ABC-2 family transporter protein [Paenibacillus antri]TLS49632.1 hypothetical protein FE782_24935 [Paenibacillus antri]